MPFRTGSERGGQFLDAGVVRATSDLTCAQCVTEALVSRRGKMPSWRDALERATARGRTFLVWPFFFSEVTLPSDMVSQSAGEKPSVLMRTQTWWRASMPSVPRLDGPVVEVRLMATSLDWRTAAMTPLFGDGGGRVLWRVIQSRRGDCSSVCWHRSGCNSAATPAAGATPSELTCAAARVRLLFTRSACLRCSLAWSSCSACRSDALPRGHAVLASFWSPVQSSVSMRWQQLAMWRSSWCDCRWLPRLTASWGRRLRCGGGCFAGG